MYTIRHGDDGAVCLEGECRLDALPGLRRSLEKEVRAHAGNALTLDLEQFQTVSSAVLSLLLCVLRAASDQECQLHIRSMPPKLFDMARVGGLESIFSS